MWDPVKLKNDTWYCWHLNGAALYLRRENELWRLAFKAIPFHEMSGSFDGPLEDNAPEDLPETLAWGKGDTVLFRPRLCNLPYIIQTKEKLRIAPGQKISFTAALPPQILPELEDGSVLSELMPLTLPLTFYGPNPMKGEFGNFLPIKFIQEETSFPASIFVHCELVITNGTKTMQEPENISINPNPLNIYTDQGKLFADTLEMEYHETDWKISITPIKDKGYRLVREGVKSGVGESIVRHSAHILKHITHLGDHE
jgi:hypothetical protein